MSQGTKKPSPVRSESPSVVGFQEEAPVVLEALQDAILALFTACVSENPHPQDLSRELGIDSTLAWKLVRASQSEDVFEGAIYLPAAGGMSIFVEACRRAGADLEFVTQIETAWDGYQSFSKRHASDRETLQTMLLNLSGDGGVVPLVRRKAAYKANSGIWGVQAATQLGIFFVRPNPEFPQTVDIASVKGLISARCLRPDVEWPLWTQRWMNDSGQLRENDGGISVEASPEDLPSQYLADFCSKPSPRILRKPASRGLVSDNLVSTGMGATAESTYVSAELLPTIAPRFREPKNTVAEFTVTVRTPVEAVIVDVVAENGTFLDGKPELISLSRLIENAPLTRDERMERDIFLLEEQPEQFNPGGRGARCKAYSRSAELHAHMFARLGWNPDNFVGWRAVIPFPVLPSSVIMSFGLPDGFASIEPIRRRAGGKP